MEKQIYIANCIECGERFTSTFKTSETNKDKLFEIGQEHAAGWGAECISVKKWVPEIMVSLRDNTTGKITEDTEKSWNSFNANMIQIKDTKTGKIIGTTQRKLNNWLAKHPKAVQEEAKKRYIVVGRGSTRYTVVKTYPEPEPADVWDNDLSTDENLNKSKAGKEKVTC